MWYKSALKGHKTYYDFNDLSYELIQVSDTEDSDWKPSGPRMRIISYSLNAYDLEHMDKDKPDAIFWADLGNTLNDFVIPSYVFSFFQ